MYKKILLAIILIFIAGCTKPKPEQIPSWYTNIPHDYKFFYAVGSSDTREKAIKRAIASMRSTLSANINKTFINKTNLLQPISVENLKNILETNEDIANRLTLSKVKLEKYKNFKGEELVLISVKRIDLFNKLKIISDLKLGRAKEQNKKAKNKDVIRRFMALEPIMKSYAILASLAGYKQFLISTYSANSEFVFLKGVADEYDELKSTINIYVLTDSNSRIFSSTLKKAINDKGFSTSNTINSKHSVKLLVTSKTTNTKDYTFKQSSSLVKLTTFDTNKEKISFRQHTFVGKSRKNHIEAKQQAAIHLKYRVKKLGILDFLGF